MYTMTQKVANTRLSMSTHVEDDSVNVGLSGDGIVSGREGGSRDGGSSGKAGEEGELGRDHC